MVRVGYAVGLAVRDLSLSPPAPGGLEADRHCARTHGSTDPATATRSRSTRTKSRASASRSRPSTPRPPRSAQTGRLVLDQQATRAPASHRPGRATKTGRSGGRDPLRVFYLLFCPPSHLSFVSTMQRIRMRIRICVKLSYENMFATSML